MDLLSRFNISPHLTRSEFIDILSSQPVRVISSLRQSLFTQLSALNVIDPAFEGVPLVTRKDSALRPVSRVLCDDCWILVDCISNKVPIPRTLLKNGKRVVSDQPRPDPVVLSPSAAPSDGPSTPPLSSSACVNNHTTSSPHSQSHLSNRFVAREFKTRLMNYPLNFVCLENSLKYHPL